jgi:hypothetical protein
MNSYLNAIEREDYLTGFPQDLGWLKRNTAIFNQPDFITHNEHKVMILGDGVWIVLQDDGTWFLEDTTGG